jgi:hypothetical protein
MNLLFKLSESYSVNVPASHWFNVKLHNAGGQARTLQTIADVHCISFRVYMIVLRMQ